MKVVMIGAVGAAKNIIEHIIDANKFPDCNIQIAGIIIDSFPAGTLISDVPVLGGKEIIKEIIEVTDYQFLFCLYKQNLMEERSKLLESLNIPSSRFANFIHPSVYISKSVKLGVGNVILSNSTVHSDVKIGNFNIINSNVTVGHESIIDMNNFIASNAVIGSKVHLVSCNFIGSNSSIREYVTLNKTFVGMHSLVLNNFENCCIIGAPAKKWIKKKL